MKLNSRITALALTALALAAFASLGCGHQSSASHGSSAPVAEVRSAEPVAPAAVESEAPAASDPVPAEPAPAEATSARPADGGESPENDAEAVAAKQGQRPPADRTPPRPGEAEKITFDDLNLGMPANILYRPFMLSDRAKELEGRKISILGYIHGAPESRTGIKEFVLLKNTECKFGKDGQADHLAMVSLMKGTTTSFTTEPVKVEGQLRIEPFHGDDSGITWAIYHLDDATVK